MLSERERYLECLSNPASPSPGMAIIPLHVSQNSHPLDTLLALDAPESARAFAQFERRLFVARHNQTAANAEPFFVAH
jgi:hypothetical protein